MPIICIHYMRMMYQVLYKLIVFIKTSEAFSLADDYFLIPEIGYLIMLRGSQEYKVHKHFAWGTINARLL